MAQQPAKADTEILKLHDELTERISWQPKPAVGKAFWSKADNAFRDAAKAALEGLAPTVEARPSSAQQQQGDAWPFATRLAPRKTSAQTSQTSGQAPAQQAQQSTKK